MRREQLEEWRYGISRSGFDTTSLLLVGEAVRTGYRLLYTPGEGYTTNECDESLSRMLHSGCIEDHYIKGLYRKKER